MWFAYMDETGNTGRNLDDPDQPIHLVLTMAVEESNVRALHEHVRDTARRYCSSVCGEDDFEFHGKELFSAEGHFAERPPEDGALRDLANYQEVGTSWGWKAQQIERIVDTIHFVPSHRNPAIQLADCATYVAARMRKVQAGLVSNDRGAQAVRELWEKRVEPFVWTNSIWHPTPWH